MKCFETLPMLSFAALSLASAAMAAEAGSPSAFVQAPAVTSNAAQLGGITNEQSSVPQFRGRSRSVLRTNDKLVNTMIAGFVSVAATLVVALLVMQCFKAMANGTRKSPLRGPSDQPGKEDDVCKQIATTQDEEEEEEEKGLFQQPGMLKKILFATGAMALLTLGGAHGAPVEGLVVKNETTEVPTTMNILEGPKSRGKRALSFVDPNKPNPRKIDYRFHYPGHTNLQFMVERFPNMRPRPHKLYYTVNNLKLINENDNKIVDFAEYYYRFVKNYLNRARDQVNHQYAAFNKEADKRLEEVKRLKEIDEKEIEELRKQMIDINEEELDNGLVELLELVEKRNKIEEEIRKEIKTLEKDLEDETKALEEDLEDETIKTLKEDLADEDLEDETILTQPPNQPLPRGDKGPLAKALKEKN